jgi:hypothetical protein
VQAVQKNEVNVASKSFAKKLKFVHNTYLANDFFKVNNNLDNEAGKF